jgi:CheY-like chemotaxis protein
MKLVLSSSAGWSGRSNTEIAQLFSAELNKPIRRNETLRCLGGLVGIETNAHGVAMTGIESPPPSGIRPLRILLAEDNKVNQLLAVSLLTKAGHRVDVAGNGIEALVSLKARPYEIVLMDMQMPEMDGLKATRAIRALAGPVADIPIIAMTANALKGDRERCLAAGMNDYVSKPIERDLLLQKIAFWTNSEAPAAARMAGSQPPSRVEVSSEAIEALQSLLKDLDSLDPKALPRR